MAKVVTASSELSLSREASNRSSNQEIPFLLWKPKVRYQYHARKSPPLAHVRKQTNSVKISPSPKILEEIFQYGTVLPYMHRSSENNY
jgi:hypothetical protein